jgi:hypothetical protein
MAEGLALLRPSVAIWLQAAGMLLAAVGIVFCLAKFVVDAINLWIGVAA